MKDLSEYINEASGINEVRLSDLKRPVSTERTYKYHPKDNDELQKIVSKLIKERGNDADLNDIDTSKVTDMSYTFYNYNFNGDISGWDVSHVEDMSYMFQLSRFNGDISDWDVSNVKTMRSMFYNSDFNGDISRWDVSSVKDMSGMFCLSDFNGDISRWYVQPDTDTEFMFANCPMRKIPDWYKPTLKK